MIDHHQSNLSSLKEKICEYVDAVLKNKLSESSNMFQPFQVQAINLERISDVYNNFRVKFPKSSLKPAKKSISEDSESNIEGSIIILTDWHFEHKIKEDEELELSLIISKFDKVNQDEFSVMGLASDILDEPIIGKKLFELERCLRLDSWKKDYPEENSFCILEQAIYKRSQKSKVSDKIKIIEDAEDHWNVLFNYKISDESSENFSVNSFSNFSDVISINTLNLKNIHSSLEAEVIDEQSTNKNNIILDDLGITKIKSNEKNAEDKDQLKVTKRKIAENTDQIIDLIDHEYEQISTNSFRKIRKISSPKSNSTLDNLIIPCDSAPEQIHDISLNEKADYARKIIKNAKTDHSEIFNKTNNVNDYQTPSKESSKTKAKLKRMMDELSQTQEDINQINTVINKIKSGEYIVDNHKKKHFIAESEKNPNLIKIGNKKDTIINSKAKPKAKSNLFPISSPFISSFVKKIDSNKKKEEIYGKIDRKIAKALFSSNDKEKITQKNY